MFKICFAVVLCVPAVLGSCSDETKAERKTALIEIEKTLGKNADKLSIPETHLHFFVLAKLGREKDAIHLYGQAIERLQADPVVQYGYLKVLQDAGDEERAVSFLSEMLKKYPDQARFLFEKGMYRIRSGDLETGIKLLKKAKELDPWFSPARIEYAKHETGREVAIAEGSHVLATTEKDEVAIDELLEILTSRLGVPAQPPVTPKEKDPEQEK